MPIAFFLTVTPLFSPKVINVSYNDRLPHLGTRL
ncbi:hypothetical protein LSH36_143g06013 [Paralvinella palmiformis]|uniref:Uncharacterized protein n=1 Tax=Paralvinella palmiformis TaxID=53620 RepID=A0AAD9NAD9_9ANNE|nr:hypothetical protein LSH36_143g06013 [Paralvinella palmiformis]